MEDAQHREAACACGGLAITLRGAPELVSACACQACQRRTGAPFGVTAIYANDQVVGRSETANVWERTAESGNSVTYRFCPTCGTTVWWEAQARPGKVAVAVGAFADKHFPPPQRMIWTDYCASWVQPPERAPKFARAP